MARPTWQENQIFFCLTDLTIKKGGDKNAIY